jgi:ribosomal protein S17
MAVSYARKKLLEIYYRSVNDHKRFKEHDSDNEIR